MVLAILLCATLMWVALGKTEQTSERLFFGVFAVVISTVLIYWYRQETTLAHDHLVVPGTITEIKRRPRRKQMIKYTFVALNGAEYTGESDWQGRTNIGKEIVVLYNPLRPTTNQPLKRFLFYSFQAYGS